MIVYRDLMNFGRLGNQLHQVAATISHAKKMKTRAQFPAWEYNKYLLNPIDDTLDTTYDEIYEGQEHEVYLGLQYHYLPIPEKKNLILMGFYQSEKYFDKELVLNTFKPKQELLQVVRTAGKDFLHLQNLTSIHVRHGDYLDRQDFHPVLPLEYYSLAMDDLYEKNGKNVNYVVFSDDIPWCKKKFKAPNIHFAEGNSNIVDLYLMAQCRNHIIANSSFSWWGSYLSQMFNAEAGQTYAPQKWFGPACDYDTKDLYCEGWKII